MKGFELLKSNRKKYGWTQKEVAKKLHISHNTYSQYETGKRSIDIDMYREIAKVLEMDVSVLFERNEQQKELKKKVQEYKCLAERDFLTGIYNRRVFIEKGTNYVAQTKQANVSFFLMDVDNFKAYNDEFGHDMGDRLLKEVANVLLKIAKREGALVGRLGGEEFALFVEGDEKRIEKVAKDILKSVKEIKLIKEVTISIGITKYQTNTPFVWEELFVQADNLLYEAKKTGKNKAVST